jgi:hypothetical protein
MTTAQVWHYAKNVGLDADDDFGGRPVDSLRSALHCELHDYPVTSLLISTQSRPCYYYLRATDMAITSSALPMAVQMRPQTPLQCEQLVIVCCTTPTTAITPNRYWSQI